MRKSGFEHMLSGGNPRSLGRAEEVVQLVLTDPDCINELLDCVFNDDEIVRMRASDAIEKVCRQAPNLLQPYISRLLNSMSNINQASVQWHLAQILGNLSLNSDQKAKAIDILRRNLTEYEDWIVINLTLETFAKFARENSSLKEEFIRLLRKHCTSKYKSIASRASKLLKEFETGKGNNMNLHKHVIPWLLSGDPAIRWQTLRDLTDASNDEVMRAQKLVATQGWGAKLLKLQDPEGTWSKGIYSPKWTSTTYTLLLLRRLGLPVGHPQALAGCKILMDNGFYQDNGINFSKSHEQSETCITGMVLSIVSYFHFSDERVPALVEHLLHEQMEDGGWNCQRYLGAIHSSVHTTISVLEGLREYEKTFPNKSQKVSSAQNMGREFLLQHKLFRSDKTGKVIKPEFTRFSFPPRWHYDILRALDYLQECGCIKDDRMDDAIEIIYKKQTKNGQWVLQNRHPGRTFFELEQIGKPSRWNTLRASRILRWWESHDKVPAPL